MFTKSTTVVLDRHLLPYFQSFKPRSLQITSSNQDKLKKATKKSKKLLFDLYQGNLLNIL
jgi:hypothetical protein